MPKALAADYSLSPDEMAAALRYLIAADIPAMMWGQPGAGKSSVAAQTAAALSMAISDVRLAQLDPVDLRGIPWRDENGRTRWASPTFFPTENDPPTVLFLDELSSCVPIMQASAYQLCLERRIGETVLPAPTRIVAAGNRAEDRAVVNRMSTALASRFVHLDMKVDAEAWIEWAINGSAPAAATAINARPLDGTEEMAIEVILFLKYKPDYISTFDPRSKELAYACPRTWEFASRLVHAGLTGINSVELALLRGTIGEGVAIEFAAFLEVFKEIPPPESVLSDPTGVAIPGKPDVEIALCGALARLAEDHNMDPLVAFAKRPPLRPATSPETGTARETTSRTRARTRGRGAARAAPDSPLRLRDSRTRLKAPTPPGRSLTRPRSSGTSRISNGTAPPSRLSRPPRLPGRTPGISPRSSTASMSTAGTGGTSSGSTCKR